MFKFDLKKTLHKFIAFGCVGFVAFLVDWLMFNLFYFATKIFVFSLAMAWILSMIFNFSINRNFTFKAKGNGYPHITKQAIKWIIVYLFGFLAKVATGWFVLMFIKETTFTANIAYFAGEIAMIPVTFFGSLLWAFKKSH